MKKLMGYRHIGHVFGLIGLLVLAAIITPSMFSVNAVISMLRNNAVYVFLAVGMMVVLVTGGIDLSIGATLALAGVVCTSLMSSHGEIPTVVWVLLSLVIGILCGAFNGFVVGYLKVVPMIATLGTMYIYRGLAFLLSGGNWWFPHQISQSYQAWASKRILGIPAILWISAIVFIIAAWFLNYRTSGRRIYAIGTNVESAKVAGIKEARVRFLAFVISGALAGLAGMLFTSNYASCTYSIGDGYELQAVAICILGGVSITGGRGTVDGVLIGWLMMSVITQFISLLPGLSVWQKALQGAIIIIAVFINIAMARSSEKRFLKERGALL